MVPPEIDQLALVDAHEALRRHFEAVNFRRARLVWAVLGSIALCSLMVGIDHSPVLALAGGGSLAALLALLFLRRRPAWPRVGSVVLFAYLVAHSALWPLVATEVGLAVAFATGVVCPALFLLRLRGVELLALAAVNAGAATLRFLVLATPAELEGSGAAGPLVAVGIGTAVCAAIGWSATTRARSEFLVSWRHAAARERERLRLREEIHDARAIQLAMLPAGPPRVAGIDVAGVCVPASEVGGDYFDYFPGGDGDLAVAIGDVAGHGVASGLVLAGVRAGLHLLAPELRESPARVLERLNTIVSGPAGQRLLMTLGLARFDRARGAALWVSAGHPPPLRFDAAAGRTEPLATAHPPLGTRLPVRLERDERRFAPGDVWLLVSDGALEARDLRGREFGESELVRAFARLAASGARAEEILDGLLAELSRFRGGTAQEDDLTLVVVRAADEA
jgi:sigma-B regulation protein RsbU (phosphoserine phosphatase)